MRYFLFVIATFWVALAHAQDQPDPRLVRAAAPPGGQGKAFGIVSTGFNIGGAVGPVMFGWLLDHAMPLGIFWAAAGFMTLTVMLTLLQERRAARARRALPQPA